VPVREQPAHYATKTRAVGAAAIEVVTMPEIIFTGSADRIEGRYHPSKVKNAALWTGSPQWQIEGLRRLEIPERYEDMQKTFGFAPLGDAQGPVKTAIFSDNNARLYGIEPKKAGLEIRQDRFAALKAEYEKNGPEPSNMRYGYVHGPIDHGVFA
jgi:hypothetical protein